MYISCGAFLAKSCLVLSICFSYLLTRDSLLLSTENFSQEDKASHREARPLTGWSGLSQGGQASKNKAWPLTGRPGLSQGGQASHSEARPLREARPHREDVWHFWNIPNSHLLGLSQEGQSSHRETEPLSQTGPLTGRLGLPKEGWASHNNAVPIIERLDL